MIYALALQNFAIDRNEQFLTEWRTGSRWSVVQFGFVQEKAVVVQQTYRNMIESLHESENYEKLAEEMFVAEPNTHDLLLYLHQYLSLIHI